MIIFMCRDMNKYIITFINKLIALDVTFNSMIVLLYLCVISFYQQMRNFVLKNAHL